MLAITPGQCALSFRVHEMAAVTFADAARLRFNLLVAPPAEPVAVRLLFAGSAIQCTHFAIDDLRLSGGSREPTEKEKMGR